MLELILLVQVTNLSPIIPIQLHMLRERGWVKIRESYTIIQILHALRERSTKVEDEVLERESWVLHFPHHFHFSKLYLLLFFPSFTLNSFNQVVVKLS
jgi:hypothetical protein